MMNQALRELDKKQVIDSVKKSMERFEAGLAAPDTNPPEARTAGILEGVSSLLVKAWNHLKGAFELFVDWATGLDKKTQGIEKLLKDANA